MRAITISWVALGFCVAACATPQNIKDKSAASAALYADLATAHQTYVDALRQELQRRDQLGAANEVRAGLKPAQLKRPLALEDTRQVVQSGRALGLQIDASRVAYGAVDRFLRIDVVDPDEVASVTSRADDAFKEK